MAAGLEASSVAALRQKGTAQRQRIQREESLWLPTLARKKLDAVLDEEGVPLRDAEGKLEALRRAWAPVFKQPRFLEKEVEEYLVGKVPVLEFPSEAPPVYDDFWRCFSQMPNISPGPDRIPNSLWSGAGFESAFVAQACYSELAAGGRMHYHFNASDIAFIPKKTLAADDVEIIREAKALRTVNMKNVTRRHALSLRTVL